MPWHVLICTGALMLLLQTNVNCRKRDDKLVHYRRAPFHNKMSDNLLHFIKYRNLETPKRLCRNQMSQHLIGQPILIDNRDQKLPPSPQYEKLHNLVEMLKAILLDQEMNNSREKYSKQVRRLIGPSELRKQSVSYHQKHSSLHSGLVGKKQQERYEDVLQPVAFLNNNRFTTATSQLENGTSRVLKNKFSSKVWALLSPNSKNTTLEEETNVTLQDDTNSRPLGNTGRYVSNHKLKALKLQNEYGLHSAVNTNAHRYEDDSNNEKDDDMHNLKTAPQFHKNHNQSYHGSNSKVGNNLIPHSNIHNPQFKKNFNVKIQNPHKDSSVISKAKTLHNSSAENNFNIDLDGSISGNFYSAQPRSKNYYNHANSKIKNAHSIFEKLYNTKDEDTNVQSKYIDIGNTKKGDYQIYGSVKPSQLQFNDTNELFPEKDVINNSSQSKDNDNDRITEHYHSKPNNSSHYLIPGKAHSSKMKFKENHKHIADDNHNTDFKDGDQEFKKNNTNIKIKNNKNLDSTDDSTYSLPLHNKNNNKLKNHTNVKDNNTRLKGMYNIKIEKDDDSNNGDGAQKLKKNNTDIKIQNNKDLDSTDDSTYSLPLHNKNNNKLKNHTNVKDNKPGLKDTYNVKMEKDDDSHNGDGDQELKKNNTNIKIKNNKDLDSADDSTDSLPLHSKNNNKLKSHTNMKNNNPRLKDIYNVKIEKDDDSNNGDGDQKLKKNNTDIKIKNNKDLDSTNDSISLSLHNKNNNKLKNHTNVKDNSARLKGIYNDTIKKDDDSNDSDASNSWMDADQGLKKSNTDIKIKNNKDLDSTDDSTYSLSLHNKNNNKLKSHTNVKNNNPRLKNIYNVKIEKDDGSNNGDASNSNISDYETDGNIETSNLQLKHKFIPELSFNAKSKISGAKLKMHNSKLEHDNYDSSSHNTDKSIPENPYSWQLQSKNSDKSSFENDYNTNAKNSNQQLSSHHNGMIKESSDFNKNNDEVLKNVPFLQTPFKDNCKSYSFKDKVGKANKNYMSSLDNSDDATLRNLSQTQQTDSYTPIPFKGYDTEFQYTKPQSFHIYRIKILKGYDFNNDNTLFPEKSFSLQVLPKDSIYANDKPQPNKIYFLKMNDNYNFDPDFSKNSYSRKVYSLQPYNSITKQKIRVPCKNIFKEDEDNNSVLDKLFLSHSKLKDKNRKRIHGTKLKHIKPLSESTYIDKMNHNSDTEASTTNKMIGARHLFGMDTQQSPREIYKHFCKEVEAPNNKNA